jgi:D-serine deaminase-like pyridoxal phosphate-dependent protein
VALDYRRVCEVLADRRLPAAFVDLDALDANLAVVRETVARLGLPIRIASKSLRVRSVIEHLLAKGGRDVAGVMCYAAAEAEYLADRGITNLLLAYPIFRRADVEAAVRATLRGATLRIAVDSREGAAQLSRVARDHGVILELILCVDMSWRPLGERVHIGVRRSPLFEPHEVVSLARVVADLPQLRFAGLLGYEAQIAGLGDTGERVLSGLKRLVKRASMAELGERRRAMVAALCDAGLPPLLVNGGGSGSLADTTAETGVTETTAGSAFFKPHLFDHYAAAHMQRLEPAAFFALEVTRKPGPSFVTCSGGGYVASGAVGRDKVPLPHLPAGLALLDAEMCGEVQTPLSLPRGVSLGLGDPVVFRHAKAGELAERFDRFLLIRDGRVVDEVPSYRGEGLCFS